MKKSIIIFSLLFSFSAALMAQLDLQPGTPAEAPAFKWISKTEHDFGKLPQGIPATTTFEFENTGKTALLLSNVKPSCGCTAPDYSKEPVAPGARGFIKATYNAASPGVFQKSLTVTSNAGDPIILTIKGDVEAKANENPTMPAVTTPPAVATKPEPVKVAPTTVSVPSSTSSTNLKVAKSIEIRYAEGVAKFSAKDQKELDGIAEEAKKGFNMITINGYASKTGNPAVNAAISKQRAAKVKDYLVSKGVDAAKIMVQSFGEESNERKVEVLLVK